LMLEPLNLIQAWTGHGDHRLGDSQ
jgi:hypothetical protein